jgi:hypothetical protein
MRRLYDSVRWRKAAKWFLSRNPLCGRVEGRAQLTLCAAMGRDTAATIVDHIQPHKGDPELFWDERNWQPACAACHSGTKRIEEGHGYSQAAGVDGLPLDPGHPWARGVRSRRGGGGSNLQGPEGD